MPRTTKEKIHSLLDNIQDENVLNILMEDVIFFSSQKDIVDELSALQLKDLDAAIQEADNNETILFNNFKAEMNEWKQKL